MERWWLIGLGAGVGVDGAGWLVVIALYMCIWERGCNIFELTYLVRKLPYNINIFNRSSVRAKSASAIFVTVASSSWDTQSEFAMFSGSRKGRYCSRISGSSSASDIARDFANRVSEGVM